jgi:hypothetical protein
MMFNVSGKVNRLDVCIRAAKHPHALIPLAKYVGHFSFWNQLLPVSTTMDILQLPRLQEPSEFFTVK